MFGRSRKSSGEVPAKSAAISVSTIPEVFYGGNDPESNLGGKMAPTKAVASKTMTSAVDENPVRTKLIAGVMIFIFLSACAGAGWYYWNYLSDGSPVAKAPVQTSPANETAVVPPATVDIVTPTTTEVITETTSTIPTVPSLNDLALDFPDQNQIDTTDFDADGLTDLEEEVFGTDPSIFDTDKDEYYDGQEVSNLYNPKGLAPVRIIDSGLVREYVANDDLYRIYYPIPWTVGTVDPAGKTILITAANGDYIEIRQFSKNAGEDFGAWFGRTATTERITDLESGANRFGVNYLRRKDNLVTYIDQPGYVLVVMYHASTSAPISFRHIMRMMIESMRVKGVGTTVDTMPVLATSSTAAI